MPDSSMNESNCVLVFFDSWLLFWCESLSWLVCFRLIVLFDAISMISDFELLVASWVDSFLSFGLRNKRRPVESIDFLSSSAEIGQRNITRSVSLLIQDGRMNERKKEKLLIVLATNTIMRMFMSFNPEYTMWDTTNDHFECWSSLCRRFFELN